MQAGRGPVSLIYAFGLVSLTFGVRLFGERPTQFRHAPQLPAFVGCMASAGLLVAAASTSYFVTFTGFALNFGLANGVGYAATLEIGAQALPTQSGTAMALVTAGYAVGATIASLFMGALVEAST